MIDTKALRQKILDLAIRGKLVPQDPDDEPASVLLERIRQQKQQMVKEGKLKPKDIKNDSVIFVGEDNLHYEKFADGSVKCIEDEIPFDLPEGWAWVRLVSLIEAFITGPFGSALHKSDYVADGIPLINPMNITDGKVIPIDKMQVSPETAERLSSFKVAPSDIVIARRGVILTTEDDGFLLIPLNLALLDEFFFLCPDAFQKDRRRLIIRVLRNELASDSEVEDFHLCALSQCGKFFFLTLDALCKFKCPLERCNDPMLFFDGRNRHKKHPQFLSIDV